MKVREAFGADPNYNDFCRECVGVGEAIENLEHGVLNEYYSNGVQAFNFRKENFLVSVQIEELDEEGWEEYVIGGGE